MRAFHFAMFLTMALSQAEARPIHLDQTIKSQLRPGGMESFEISLNPGDYAQLVVDQIKGCIDITVYDPAGEKVKTVSNNPISANGQLVETSELEEVHLIALRQGNYRLDARAVGGPEAGEIRYTISYAEHMTISERTKLPPVFHRDRSPRIEALQKELKSGNRAALATFWENVNQKGSPLIEAIPDDPKHMLVTVVWRNTVGVQNVGLHWESYAYNDPDQYAFTRLLDTDLWYLTLRLPFGARFVYQVSPNDDLIPYSRFDSADSNAVERHNAGAMPDPLNPNHWIQHNGDFSLAELPGAPAQPWINKQPNIAEGSVKKASFKSESLKNEREIAIYTPSGYSKSHSPYWLMILFDEKQYLTTVPTAVILDNLIAAKKIPPMVAVLIDALDRETRRNETMGAMAATYIDAIAKELVPWVRQNYNVGTSPAQTIIAGSSANGFASVYGAWRHPDVFGNVLCQSGALFWQPGFALRIGDEPEWLARQLASNRRKPIRFFVEAGLFEDNREGILDSSRHFRDTAVAKGYDIHYQEFAGGHNYINWRGSIADGLIYLTNPRKKQPQGGDE